MFVRSILALSLSCIIASNVYAAVEDPIDPLAIDATNQASSSAATQISQQEQKDLNQAASTLQSLGKAEDQNAEIGKAPTSPKNTDTQKTDKVAKASWTLDGLNNAEWYDNIGRGQFPVYARAHVMLNNAHASPGAIDGTSGMNTLKAISSFQKMQSLNPSGVLNQETWDRLISLQGNKPAFVEYTITEADLKGPYAASIPRDYALQAKMKGLYYTRVSEMLGEKFHMDEAFLQKLNPNATFKKAGERIVVTNIRNELPENIHLIVAHKGAKQL